MSKSGAVRGGSGKPSRKQASRKQVSRKQVSRQQVTRKQPPPRPVAQRTEPAPSRFSDRAVAAVVALVTALLTAATISDQVEYGDSAEAVASVDALGIAHAPGYALYAAAARVFSTLLPVGDLALRVNVFSVVCAAGASVLLFLLVRRWSGGQAAAAAAGVAHAVGLSSWFYGGYAKSYAFTALLLVGILLALTSWRLHGRKLHLVLAATLVGLSLGASYQAVAACVPGLIVLVLTAQRRPKVVALLLAVAAGLAAAAAVAAYTIWRARSAPPVNWGEAVTLGRFVDMVLMRDFSLGQGSVPGRGGASLLDLPIKALRVLLTLVREFGPLVLLAPLGAVWTWRQRSRAPFWGLLAILLGNVLAFVLGVRVGPSVSVSSSFVLGVGGFLLPAKVVLAAWIGLGAGVLVDRPALRVRLGKRLRSVPRATVLAPALALLLVGTVALNAPLVQHRSPDVTAQYARDMLDPLPENAVLFTMAVEPTFVLEHAQVVEDVRPDVDIYRIPHLLLDWYRDQRELGPQPDPLDPSDRSFYAAEYEETARLARGLLDEGRPVFVELQAAQQAYRRLLPLGMVHQGLVARASGKPGPTGLDVKQAQAAAAGYDDDALVQGRRLFHGDQLARPYSVALAELGLALKERNDLQGAEELLVRAVRIDPSFEVARTALAELRAGTPADGDR